MVSFIFFNYMAFTVNKSTKLLLRNEVFNMKWSFLKWENVEILRNLRDFLCKDRGNSGKKKPFPLIKWSFFFQFGAVPDSLCDNCAKLQLKRNFQYRLKIKEMLKTLMFCKGVVIFLYKNEEIQVKNSLLSNGQFYFPSAKSFVSYYSTEL